MNAKTYANAKTSVLSTLIALLLAVITMFASSSIVWAYPAEPEEQPRNAIPASTVSAACPEVDIPARRADYARLDDPTRCPVVAGASTLLIPNTGSVSQNSRYNAFKDMQADLASGGNTGSTQLKHHAMDPRFAAFKERQAEQRGR